MRTKKEQKKLDARIETLYKKHCSNIQINIFDISKVYATARQAFDNGAIDDDALGQAIINFVETIRKN